MPTETNRKTTLKRVKDPYDSAKFIDIPIIDEIEFRDPKTNSQEYNFRFNNTDRSSRTTHVKQVSNPSGGDTLAVERIDQVNIRDPKTNNQEHGYRFSNRDPPPRTATVLLPKHIKTHIVRYTKDNTLDGTPWIDVELIDEIEFRDPKTNSQEHTYRLRNQAIGAAINDSDDPFNPTLYTIDTSLTKSPGNTTVDPPYRLDPFQNIVNLRWRDASDTSDPARNADYFYLTSTNVNADSPYFQACDSPTGPSPGGLASPHSSYTITGGDFFPGGVWNPGQILIVGGGGVGKRGILSGIPYIQSTFSTVMGSVIRANVSGGLTTSVDGVVESLGDPTCYDFGPRGAFGWPIGGEGVVGSIAINFGGMVFVSDDPVPFTYLPVSVEVISTGNPAVYDLRVIFHRTDHD